MIVDCHVHHYPPEAIADPASWAAARREPRWAEMVGPRADGAVSLQGWADTDQLLRDMDQAGLDRSVLLGWYWENPATCAEQNRFLAACARRHPDRLEAAAVIQPICGEAALRAELDRCRDEGMCALGELCPPAQGYGYTDPGLDFALELAGRWGWPVNLHVTDPLSRPYPGRVETPIEDLLALVGRRRETRFVFAHFGGLLPLFGLHRAMPRPPANVWYDTAASPLLYRAEVLPRMVGAVGADRILFGSDYPLRLYPRQQERPDFARFLAEIRTSGLDAAGLGAVLGGNWLRLRSLSSK
jgi:predicted TIM-barrel fold metal-dependent hydrolase